MHTKDIVVRKGEGKAFWLLGCLGELKATGEQTGGALSALEYTVPSHALGSPPHTHDCAEAVYILEGSVRYHIGERAEDAPAGTFLSFPKGQLEWCENVTDRPAKLLVMYAPGGFERFFLEAGEPARARTLPPRPKTEPDLERLGAVARKYGMELKALEPALAGAPSGKGRKH